MKIPITTRDHLINAAYEEIYEKGYQGANTSNILKILDMNKGSMYHFFKSKKDLALCVINEKLKKRIEAKYHPFTIYQKNIIDELVSMLENVNILNIKYGCPVNNLIQEMSPLDKDFAIALESIYDYMEACIESALDKAVEINEISSSIDTRKLAMFIISSMEGSMITAKKSNSYQHYLDSISVLIEYLENLKNNSL